MTELKLPETSKNYVDKEEFLAAIIAYRKQCEVAEASGLPKPRIPEFIGSCLLKISTKFSFSAKYSANFIGYPFREDMVMDGVETCVRYFHNFDPNKSGNPFAYFTQVIYYSFLNRIQKEKKYLYTKFKSIQMQREHGISADSQEHEELSSFGIEIQDNNDYMNDYIRNYETGSAKKKEEKKGKKVAGTLDVLDDEEEAEEIDLGELPPPDIEDEA